MKHLSLCAVVLALTACGTQAPQRPLIEKAKPSVANSSTPAVEKTVETPREIFTPEAIAAMQADTPAAPENPAGMTMDDMRQQVQATFANSNLAPADSAALNADVQALLGAAEAKNFAQVSKLANGLVGKAAGLKGLNLPALGLVDIAGILDAVQDLAAAALALDIAGVLAAAMDLVAAVGA
jgi:hypothetical protein